MALSIIGAGLPRTGTLSLKTAVEQLGFGPCFHCLDGSASIVERVFSLALDRRPIDWDGIFHGYNAAVDVPFSWFYRDIAEKCPSAKFILTVRDPNAWFDSIQAIQPFLQAAERADASGDGAAKLWAVIPPEVAEILKFQNRESVVAAFEQFNSGVQNAIPADRLLVLDVNQGWQRLCEFLGASVPHAPFPHVNLRKEFPSLFRRMVERHLRLRARWQPTGRGRQPYHVRHSYLAPKWSAEDLMRRLSHALDVAGQAVERFAVNGYTDSREPGNNIQPGKLISETAYLLVGASIAAGHPHVLQRIHGVAERLLPHARSERRLLGMCIEPAFALDYARAHICLTRLGYPDPAFDAVLRKSLNSQVHAGHERPPCGMLEQEWLIRTWDGTGSKSRQRYLLAARESVLGHPMDLLSGSREDVYAFTHALMYTTDFGLRSRRLPRPAPEILAEAEAALARCLDEEDYDLGGEILLSWPLTRRSWSAAAVFGFRVLANAQDQTGFLPSPSTKLQRLDGMSGDEWADYLLATGYHTAYVMGLLCAAALQPGLAPPACIPRTAQGTGSHAPILRLLDADARRRPWREEFDRLAVPERDAITRLLFAMALRRRTMQRNFAGLRKLLRKGYQLGLANCPVASQTAEFLERVAEAAPRLLASR
jgi:Sulfotransferase domain